jgi:hypothetical protein
MTQVANAVSDTTSRLCIGFDSVAGVMLQASAVEGDYHEEGVESKVTIKVCESLEELSQGLQIDASMSISFLKAANFSAKMSFMRSLNVTEHSLSIVVHIANGIGRWFAKNVALTQEAKAKVPAVDDDAAAVDFVRQYGDSYISAVTLGGEYYAVYTFRTTTKVEQSRLSAELKAGGVYNGITAGTEVQTKITDFLKSTNVRSTFEQQITGIKGLSLPTSDKMIQFALNFPRERMNSPAMTDFAVARYENVENFGRGFDTVARNRNHFVDDKRGVLVSLAHLNGVAHQINRLLDIYEVYNFKDEALEALEKQVEADLATIDAQIAAWRDNPVGDFAKPDLPSVAMGEPWLDYSIGRIAAFGGESGPPFEFMTVGDAFHDRVRIEWIQLADGRYNGYDVMRGIAIGYISDKGRWTQLHGHGHKGNNRRKLNFEGLFPSMLRIRHGGFVDAIELTLEDGNTTSAGGPNGVPVEWKPQPGGVVLGFAGRAGEVLDQIEIVHGSLKPAQYARPRRNPRPRQALAA